MPMTQGSPYWPPFHVWLSSSMFRSPFAFTDALIAAAATTAAVTGLSVLSIDVGPDPALPAAPPIPASGPALTPTTANSAAAGVRRSIRVIEAAEAQRARPTSNPDTRAANKDRHPATKQDRRDARAKARAVARARRAGERNHPAPGQAGTSEPAETDPAPQPPVVKNPPVQSPFTLASFNALGYGHTAPGGNRKGWADGYTRTRWAIRALNLHHVDVVGLQEFQPEQHAEFTKNTAGTFAVHRVGANAVAWRTSAFAFVSAATVTIPYFGGVPTPQPVVRLRSTVSGQEVVVISVHNPADARGPAQRLRNIATANEVAYIDALRAITPRVPIFMTGDMNDREEFFCPFTASGVMRAAAGGSHTSAGCTYPSTRAHGVDWIFGSKGVTFSGYTVDRSRLVSRTSDHPLVVTKVG